MIALRLRCGRAVKAARGGSVYGSPAFGHRASGNALVLDEREQTANARARELHAAGASLREIGGDARGRGLPAEAGESLASDGRGPGPQAFWLTNRPGRVPGPAAIYVRIGSDPSGLRQGLVIVRV
jgi:hypothetical protein